MDFDQQIFLLARIVNRYIPPYHLGQAGSPYEPDHEAPTLWFDYVYGLAEMNHRDQLAMHSNVKCTDMMCAWQPLLVVAVHSDKQCMLLINSLVPVVISISPGISHIEYPWPCIITNMYVTYDANLPSGYRLPEPTSKHFRGQIV